MIILKTSPNDKYQKHKPRRFSPYITEGSEATPSYLRATISFTTPAGDAQKKQ